ncbi:MAG: hypothetical protein ACRDOI_09930 [Trebonia sp.]
MPGAPVQVMRCLRALLEDLRDSLPESRRPAVEEEVAPLDSAAVRMFSDQADQRAAAVSDRQGLGATAVPRPAPPRPAPNRKNHVARIYRAIPWYDDEW